MNSTDKPHGVALAFLHINVYQVCASCYFLRGHDWVYVVVAEITTLLEILDYEKLS